jgi:O-antigen biosynthesis protein
MRTRPCPLTPNPSPPEGRGEEGGRRVNPWPAIDKVARFARQWQEQHVGQAFESETLAGGCVLLKREVLQRLGLFPARTPLGTFDTDALSQRVRQAGYRLLGCRAAYVHYFGSRSTLRQRSTEF